MALDFAALAKKGIGIGAGGDIGFGGGPATSGTGGVSFGSFSSGGGFNPFASQSAQAFSPMIVLIIGAVMVGMAFILKRKRRK